ncbi:MAG: DUF3307 domain-containing protein [Chloroflexota bacterium]
MTGIELIATLLIGHVLGDFALQTDRIYQLKIRGGVGLFLHVILHVIVTGILLRTGYIENWFLLTILFIVHYIIDWTKLQVKTDRNLPGFVLDQLAHVGSLFLLVWLFPSTSIDIPREWLLPILIYGIIPCITMMIWVWSNDMAGTSRDTMQTRTMRRTMKTVSQLTSLPLVIGLAVWVYYTYFPFLIQ